MAIPDGPPGTKQDKGKPAKKDTGKKDTGKKDTGKKDTGKPADKSTPKPDAPLKPPVPYSGSFPGGTGSLSATLTVAGQARTVKIYKPSKAGAHPPLLLTFHGTHGEAMDMLKPGSSYARELADSKGVVLLSPQARKMTKGDWDDHYPGDVYWETYPSTNPATNPDLMLVQAMIHAASKAYKADLKRVYTLGHSNGAFFSLLAATTLPNMIAAFTENSGGLVRCAKMSACSFVGSGTSCAAFAGQPGYCSCSGAEKPGPLPASGRKPPGYLAHSGDDTTVSAYYTCELHKRMQALGYTASLKIGSGDGHSMPYNLAINAWAFMSKYKLP